MIFEDIAGLIETAADTELIEHEDKIYIRNRVMSLLHLESYPEQVDQPTDDTIPNILEKLIAYSVEHKVIEDVLDEREILSATLMDCFMARPSFINAVFNDKYKNSSQAATDYFYQLS